MKNPKTNKLLKILIFLLCFSYKMAAQNRSIDISYTYPNISKYEVLNGVQMHSIKAAYNYELDYGGYLGWMGDILLFKNKQDSTLVNSTLIGGKFGVRLLGAIAPQVISRFQPILEINFLMGLKNNIQLEYGGLIGCECYFSDKSAIVLSCSKDYFLLNKYSQIMSLYSLSLGIRFGF